MKTAVTDIDDIMFPGESSRTLAAQIKCLDLMLAALDSPSRHTGLKSALEARPAQHESLGRDVTAGPNSLGPACLMTLANGDEINVDLCNVGNWWTAKNADHDHQCGQGETREAALADLREICEEHAIRARDREWRRIVARAQA